MRDEIIARAHFLLRDLHLSPSAAQQLLKDYFPDLELEERVRYIHEARELIERGVEADPVSSRSRAVP